MIDIQIWEEADPDNHLPNPDADTTKEAVFMGEQATGTTLIIGREDKDEFISTEDMVPLDLEECR